MTDQGYRELYEELERVRIAVAERDRLLIDVFKDYSPGEISSLPPSVQNCWNAGWEASAKKQSTTDKLADEFEPRLTSEMKSQVFDWWHPHSQRSLARHAWEQWGKPDWLLMGGEPGNQFAGVALLKACGIDPGS